MGKQIAIIGAGPAGLMAAEQLAQAGCAVTVYDQMPTPARKLLIAGRGGLNLTHSEPLAKFLPRYREAAPWLETCIRAFPPEALRQWCEGLGQPTFVGSSGRVFPRSMKAVQLLRAWLRRLEQLGVQYRPRHRWLGWNGEALRFATPDAEITVTADAVLLALGGASWPRLGSDGGWVGVLAREGVAVAPLRAANSGFLVPWSDYFRSRFAGEPLKPVALHFGEETRQGEAMLTAQGIEGGVMYALSAPLREAIAAHGEATVTLDLRPGMAAEALAQKLGPRGSKSFSSYLKKANLPPMAVALVHELLPPETLAQCSAGEMARHLKALPLTLRGVAGIERAISSAGGVCHSAVDAQWMLKNKPGVFVAGEMLDWEAPTGGYLLQACFSTAVAAARGMLAYLPAGTPVQAPPTKPKAAEKKRSAATDAQQLDLF